MSLYRWFKTQVYWLIPDSFKSNNPNEFVGTEDLVTVFKNTDQDGVYENRNVTLNQLAGMIGGGSQGPVGPMGPQGPAGPAVPSGLIWEGNYVPETEYVFNSVVTWTNPVTYILGSYWVTNGDGMYDIPPTDENGDIVPGWAFLASQGAQGIQGVQGEQGPVGPQGPAGTATLPYKYYIGRITFGTANIFLGASSLTGVVIASKLGTGSYKYTFSNAADFDGSIAKYILNVTFNANTGAIYVPVCANYDSTSVLVNIYEVNPDTGEYLLTDPNVQGTFHYIKYN
jgi:hypothetical protein